MLARPCAQNWYTRRTNEALLEKGEVLQPPTTSRKARKLRADLRCVQEICAGNGAEPSGSVAVEETEALLPKARAVIEAGYAFSTETQNLLDKGRELIRVRQCLLQP